jgi:hypothetical protein
MGRHATAMIALCAALGCAATTQAEEGKEQPEAGEKEAKKAKRQRPVLSVMTVTGTVGKAERKKKTDDGEKVLVTYYLTEDSGAKVMLPGARKKAAKKAVTDFAPHVGKKVTITGKAYKRTRKSKKGGERTITVMRVVTQIKTAAQAVADAAKAETGDEEDK